MARWVLIAALCASVLATCWFVVDSHTSYVPMTDVEMQNLYLDRIVRFGGVILSFQIIAIIAAFFVGKPKSEKSDIAT